jgi:hypothetical protein
VCSDRSDSRGTKQPRDRGSEEARPGRRARPEPGGPSRPKKSAPAIKPTSAHPASPPMLSRSDLLRSLSAPPELIEADLVDQLADASEELALLRARRPDAPDLAWSRHYALVQGTYNRVLDRLARIRKPGPERVGQAETAEAPQSPGPLPAPPPAQASPRPPASQHLSDSTSPRPIPRNRYERRRLEALRKRSDRGPLAPAARISGPGHAIRPNPVHPTNPDPPGLVHSHTMKGRPGVGAGQTMLSEGSGR